jgi:hypothetical protein
MRWVLLCNPHLVAHHKTATASHTTRKGILSTVEATRNVRLQLLCGGELSVCLLELVGRCPRRLGCEARCTIFQHPIQLTNSSSTLMSELLDVGCSGSIGLLMQ